MLLLATCFNVILTSIQANATVMAHLIGQM